jgi:hypothetical protein
VPSPPPPGNFDSVPVVLSGPYEYGVKNAPPVADLHPPLGVLATAVADPAAAGGGGTAAEVSTGTGEQS